MRKRAFTLIELLVVISIFAILVAVITPSLVRAREQTKRIVCLSNLRQMAIAAANYTFSNDDYYPIAQYWQSSGSVTYEYCWDFTSVTDTSEKRIEPGILWQGDTIEKIHQCPSYKGPVTWLDQPYSGYNYNTSYIGHGQGEAIEEPAKVTEVGSPASCALFGDGHYSGGANKFMRSPRIWAGCTDFNIRAGGTQGYRHNGVTNVAWCDGHADSQKQLYTESYPNVRLEIENYNDSTELTGECKIGFLSPDNSAYNLK